MAVLRLWLTLVLVGLCSPAAADLWVLENWPTAFDGRLPKGMPPGEGWRAVSGDGTLLTSDCVGEFSSPECILDTMMACDAWSNVDHITGHDARGNAYRHHPICARLMSDPFYTPAGLKTFGFGGTDHPEHFVLYYKPLRFVVTVENMYTGPGLDRPAASCFWCPDDIGLAFLLIRCQPFPLYNKRATLEGEFRIVDLFQAKFQGTAFEGYPFLDDLYARHYDEMRQGMR